LPDTPRPLSPENAPNPPDASEMGALSSGETEKGKGGTSSALYRTSSDAYLIPSDKEETKLGSPRLSSDKDGKELGSYLIPSDQEETDLGKDGFSSGKDGNELGKEENASPRSENRPAPVMRGRRTLPASPVERARLEAQGGVQQNELNDRSTQVAFALLFVVPLLIILLSLLLFFPFIARQMGNDDPSGVRIQTAPNLPADAQR